MLHVGNGVVQKEADLDLEDIQRGGSPLKIADGDNVNLWGAAV